MLTDTEKSEERLPQPQTRAGTRTITSSAGRTRLPGPHREVPGSCAGLLGTSSRSSSCLAWKGRDMTEEQIKALRQRLEDALDQHRRLPDG